MTEEQVERSFRKLVNQSDLQSDILDRAEALLDELRPESPLRHRLAAELDELRKLSIS